MEAIHVCTTADMVAGGEEMDLDCPICMTTCKHTVGYIGALCSNCGTCLSDAWLGEIAERRRKYLGLSRAECAKKFGLLHATITAYETKHCSRKYAQQLADAVRTKNAEHNTNKNKGEGK